MSLVSSLTPQKITWNMPGKYSGEKMKASKQLEYLVPTGSQQVIFNAADIGRPLTPENCLILHHFTSLNALENLPLEKIVAAIKLN
jgi:hypothetical protein